MRGNSQLADFEAVDSVPTPYDQLLDHNAHMTVTVESHYGELVDVHVHRCQTTKDSAGKFWYGREITLVTSQSKQIVQYGIVRLNIESLAPEVWQLIESQQVPLGRALIQHNVLREVQLCGLWKVLAGVSLAGLMHLSIGSVLYGRTALIYCDGAPAIELLEIVSPVPGN
jgi:chorismate-pyruvate lyase